jgi:bifunctional non-homologous end joining protein LigD
MLPAIIGFSVLVIDMSRANNLHNDLQKEHAGTAPKGMKRPATQGVKPGITARVKYLRGEAKLRHASLQDFQEA